MKVKMTSHVKHDGKELKPGDAVDLPDEIANRLIAGNSASAEGVVSEPLTDEKKRGKKK